MPVAPSLHEPQHWLRISCVSPKHVGIRATSHMRLKACDHGILRVALQLEAGSNPFEADCMKIAALFGLEVGLNYIL
jgi:hypothetical protein